MSIFHQYFCAASFNAMGINCLPDEVLCQHVFPHLDLRSRAIAEQTCRRWRILLQDMSQPPIDLWVGNAQDNHNYPDPPCVGGRYHNTKWEVLKISETMAEPFLKKHSGGKVLLLRSDNDTSVRKLLNVVDSHWNRMENFQIEIAYTENDIISHIITLKIAAHVTRLWLTTVVVTNSMLLRLFETCTNLEALCLAGIHDVEYYALKELPSRLRTLYFAHLSNIELDTLVGGKAQQLTEFSTGPCDATQLSAICNCMKGLLTLKFAFADEHNPKAIWSLVKLKKLQNLSFDCWTPDNDIDFVQVLSNFPDLKTLELGNGCISDKLLMSLPKCTPKLEAISLFSDESSERFSKAMQKLPELNRLPRLRTLDIEA